MHRERFFPVSIFGALVSVASLVTAGAAMMEAGDDPTVAGGTAAVGTAFTYQGRLGDGGSPASGPYDLEFKLFDADVLGTQVGSTVTLEAVPVADGLFTARIDFGDMAFGGGQRWLEIGVRPGASGDPFTILAPRQELTPTPYALALPNVHVRESLPFVGIGRDFRISGNEVFGVRYEGNPNQYGGMYVETADAGGWLFYGYATAGSFRAWHYYDGTTDEWKLYSGGERLTVPGDGGLVIGPTTVNDGLRVSETADDGFQVGVAPDYPNYGLYIPSPGVPICGLWPNTANAAGEWALYTVDKIEAGNVTLGSLSLVARVTGPDAMTPGDVVAPAGVTDPLPGSTAPLPLVELAAGARSGTIGVVESRMVWGPAPGKEAEGEMSLHSAPGPATAGDYVALTVLGVAQVKVGPGAAVAVGDRLTSSDARGKVRGLRTEQLNGMTVSEAPR